MPTYYENNTRITIHCLKELYKRQEAGFRLILMPSKKRARLSPLFEFISD